MKAILTCCVCYTRIEVDASIVVAGDDLETWWLLRRRQTCAECFKHTCWHSMAFDTVCWKDLGHAGGHYPWRDEYGDTDPGIPPFTDLWANWDREVHPTA